MASIYEREESAFLYVRYKDETGKWKAKPTEYRKDNIGDRRQATLLARRQTEREQVQKIDRGRALSGWVLPWIDFRWGNSSSGEVYKRQWRNLSQYLEEKELPFAESIKRDFLEQYMTWRTTGKDGVSRNYAIQEIKMMSRILEEALVRDLITKNPLRKPGIRKEKVPGKTIWTDDQISEVAAYVQKNRTHWQRCTFFFGLFQACRLRQCRLPLSMIRLDRKIIQYPGIIVKGGLPYAQPIDDRFFPILEELVFDARKDGRETLCDVKWDASLSWRSILDRIGHEEICHHGLRATWITKAAENDVPESLAMEFCHQSSAEVHRIYKQVRPETLIGVSAAVPFPKIAGLLPGRPASDAPPAMPCNEEGAPAAPQTPRRNRERNRRRFAGGRSRGTAQAPLFEAESPLSP